MADESAPHQHEFKTELKQILEIITHSLYSNTEIFLRELISNASDAIDRVRFESLTDTNLEEGDSNWKIKVTADKDAKTLTISDNGIGMSEESIVNQLGTIARSGTKEFVQRLKEAKADDQFNLIGQFGVGFYASFMVADKVTVVTRMGGLPADQAIEWVSDGQGTYSLETVTKESRGTDVILHLKDDQEEFLDEWRIREIIKRYSDFVEHPIVMDQEETEGEGDEQTTKIVENPINAQKTIWLRQPSDISEEDYNEFYKQISNDWTSPAKTIHLTPEGKINFKAILYLPAKKPFDFNFRKQETGLQLFIQRVMIMRDCEDLLPEYLRFVRGVVDSADLPLNVSRELLQANKLVANIRSTLVNRILRELDRMKSKKREDYEAFYQEFEGFLKEGVNTDFANKEKLADLLLFESTKTEAGKFTTLADYVEQLKDEDDEIYVLTGESRALLESSPYLEAFKARDQEVLLLTHPMDEWVLSSLTEYKGRKLKQIDKGEIESQDERDEETKKEETEKYGGLFDHLQGFISDVKEIRPSTRLTESAACLVSEEDAMSAHMERLMKELGQGDAPTSKRILELNTNHEAVKALQQMHDSNPEDTRIETYGRLLYDQAVVAEGSKINDPADFARRINGLISQSVG